MQSADSDGDNWFHKRLGDVVNFGDSGDHTFVHQNIYGQPTNGDVGLVEIRTSEDVYTQHKNRIYTDFGGGTIHPVTAVVHNANQVVGSQACAYGAASNDYYCTIINNQDTNREYCVNPPWGDDDCFIIKRVKTYGYDLVAGDSGGPIFQRASQTSINVWVLGTHVHSTDEDNGTAYPATNGGYYTSYDWGKTAFSQTNNFAESYNACITTSC